MEVRAVTKYVGISPQKTRWVIDQVRGMQAEQALALLRYMTQSAAEPVAKTIASALANAEENLGLAREDMYIADDHGRWRAVAPLAAVWCTRPVQADHSAVVAHHRRARRTRR